MADKTPAEIRGDMWRELGDSPFLMIGLEGQHRHAVPMTAQLDPDAHGKFWIYTHTHSRIAAGGPAMAQFVAKGHHLYACIAGTLVAETDGAVIDRYWSDIVEAWYDQGRTDPDLLMLRFELDDAEVWETDTSIAGAFRMLTGRKVDPSEAGSHAEVALR
jgi:general stress protein 26